MRAPWYSRALFSTLYRGGFGPVYKFSEQVAVHKALLLFHSRGSRITLTRSQLSQWCMCCVRDCTLWQAAQSLLISMRQAQRKKMGGSIAKREARRKRQCNVRLEGERKLMKSIWSIHYSCYRSWPIHLEECLFVPHLSVLHCLEGVGLLLNYLFFKC